MTWTGTRFQLRRLGKFYLQFAQQLMASTASLAITINMLANLDFFIFISY